MSYNIQLKNAIDLYVDNLLSKNYTLKDINLPHFLKSIQREMEQIDSNIARNKSSFENWREICSVAFQCAEIIDRNINKSNFCEILCYKHKRYGTQNLIKRGEYGILVRLDDKISRAENLIVSEENDIVESLADTFLDIAGYAIQAIGMIEGWFYENLEDENL